MNKDNKKIIIKRNMIATFFGMITMIIVVWTVPFYDILTDMQVTDLDSNMEEINRKYLLIVLLVSFISFVLAFYISKAIFNVFLKMKQKRKENINKNTNN